jgi:hypothetical protein
MADGGCAVVQAEGLARRYARALDRLDPELLRTCFHENALIEMGSIYSGGPDGFVEIAMGFMGSMRATRHLVSNTASVGKVFETYVDAWHLVERDGSLFELMVRGRYLQKVSQAAGDWRLSWHSEVVDFGEERIADGRWFEGDVGMPLGRRDRRDPSYLGADHDREAGDGERQ